MIPTKRSNTTSSSQSGRIPTWSPESKSLLVRDEATSGAQARGSGSDFLSARSRRLRPIQRQTCSGHSQLPWSKDANNRLKGRPCDESRQVRIDASICQQTGKLNLSFSCAQLKNPLAIYGQTFGRIPAYLKKGQHQQQEVVAREGSPTKTRASKKDRPSFRPSANKEIEVKG